MAPSIDREEQQTSKNFLKFVMFGLGRERYAVPVLKVKEIIAGSKIFPLPKMPDFIEGIISLRGEIIPIVDLRKRFDLPAVEKTEESRIVVLEMENFYVGISVDQVYEVIKMEEEAIEPPPPLVGGLRADFLEGVCEINAHLITILNLEQIFSSTERVILAEAAGAEKTVPSPDKKERGSGDDFLSKWSDAVSSDAPRTPPAVSAPSFRPDAAADVAVGDDGKVKHSGRTLYLGSKYAGKKVRIEPTADGLVVREGEQVIKRFKI